MSRAGVKSYVMRDGKLVPYEPDSYQATWVIDHGMAPYFTAEEVVKKIEGMLDGFKEEPVLIVEKADHPRVLLGVDMALDKDSGTMVVHPRLARTSPRCTCLPTTELTPDVHGGEVVMRVHEGHCACSQPVTEGG